jgi:hypothetical protein
MDRVMTASKQISMGQRYVARWTSVRKKGVISLAVVGGQFRPANELKQVKSRSAVKRRRSTPRPCIVQDRTTPQIERGAELRF